MRTRIARAPRFGLALQPSEDFRAAASLLIAAEEVDAVEWSFDTAWGRELPPWLEGLLDAYAAEGQLYGHGVGFSLLSARWESRQATWLERLAKECRERPYEHISEHLGFITAQGWLDGSPLPVPFTRETVALGRDRLARLADAAGRPIGLENLALALSPLDVAQQGDFLEELLVASDGFLLLDLHNLYCQAVNFDRSPTELLTHYPLARVRELHLSGGSDWRRPSGKGSWRRDTHDGPVPPALHALLRETIGACPRLEVVFLERLGGTLAAPADAAAFQAEYRALRQIVQEATA